MSVMEKAAAAAWTAAFLLILLASVQDTTAAAVCDKVTAMDALRDYVSTGTTSLLLPTQGPICGADSCCGAMETATLRTAARKNVDSFYRHSVAQLGSVMEVRARRLEELFREMMAKSKKELHAMFERTYGMIYLQNSVVFTDFFAELERYYNHGGISLTETIDRFFSILYQRMFKVINAQYDFDDEYLACVAKDIAELMPFGDIPRKLATLLRRAFVATRTFHRALSKGAQVADRMLKWNVFERDCATAVTKMQFCSYCKGLPNPPCSSYCSDTLKECFANVAELNEKWDTFIDGLDKIADKLLGPFNIEMVVEPINVKISEAIMNFQESGSDVSNKVFQICGQPKLKGDRRRRRRRAAAVPKHLQQQRSEAKEVKFQPLRFPGGAKGGKKNKKQNNRKTDYERYSPMEKRIIEVKQKIKETRNFWGHLPYQYCNNISTAAPSERTCWNGHSVDEYVMPSTPTPSTDTYNQQWGGSKNRNPLVLEQVYVLNVLIAKLESAYLGQDDELSDDDDDEDSFVQSGSGSGDGGDNHEDDEDDAQTPYVSSTTTTTTTTQPSSTSTMRSPTTESVGGGSSTGPTSVIVSKDDSNEVDVIVKEYERPPEVVQAASAADVARAVAYYVLPVVMVWFGGAVVEIL